MKASVEELSTRMAEGEVMRGMVGQDLTKGLQERSVAL